MRKQKGNVNDCAPRHKQQDQKGVGHKQEFAVICDWVIAGTAKDLGYSDEHRVQSAAPLACIRIEVNVVCSPLNLQ